MDSIVSPQRSSRSHKKTSVAVQKAAEFADTYLDQAFAELEQRVIGIRERYKSNVGKAVTDGQIINLEHLLPELEYIDSTRAREPKESKTDTLPAWLAELNDTDYQELYEELEQAELATTEAAVISLINSLNRDALVFTEQNFGKAENPQQDRHSSGDTVDEFELISDADYRPQAEPSAHKEPSADAEPTAQQQPVFEPVDSATDQADTRGRFEVAADSEVDDDYARISRIPNGQSPVAASAGSALLQVDAKQVAQALVEMYLENERILNKQRAVQAEAEEGRRRRLRLIAGGLIAAVAIIAIAVATAWPTIQQSLHSRQVPQLVKSIDSTAATPRYQSVNHMPVRPDTENLSGEIRNDLEHLAASVRAEEYDYYDPSVYEPDPYADADTPYYPVAIEENGVVIEQSTPDQSAHQNAYAQWQAGNVVAAEQAYQTILDAKPDDTEALVGLGSMAQRSGNNVLAVDYLVRALKSQPDHAYALAALASLSTNVNRAQLEQDLTHLARANPNVAELPFILGNWYARDKRWQEAQQAYFDAYNRNTNNPDYAYNLAVALDQLGKSANAEKFYRLALTLAPGFAAHFDVNQARARADQLASK